MPGYNHYPWCGCGWCVKYGFGRLRRGERAALERSFEAYSARAFLDRHRASRSFIACLVVPNASCPVCGVAVFYYENLHGSRVFFDSLGPPWPKHLCTSSSPNATNGGAVIRPKIRPRGEAAELKEAALYLRQNTGSFEFPIASTITEWDLCVVVEAARKGWNNSIKADFVGSEDKNWVQFEFTSSDAVLEVDDFFSLNKGQISVYDQNHDRVRLYKISNIKTNDPSWDAEGRQA